MKFNKFITTLGLLGAVSAFSMGSTHEVDHDHTLCEGYIPKIDEPAPISSIGYANDGISKEDFDARIALATEAYTPIVEKYGAKLTIEALWDNDTVNAMAGKNGSAWKAFMFGGLARLKGMTADAFNIVLCHEVGHLVGGFPFYPGDQGDQGAASEGNSDYFAAHDCFYRLFKDDKEQNEKAEANAPENIKELCSNAHEDSTRKQICIRSTIAGHKVWEAMLLADNSKDTVEIGKKDPKVVIKTIPFHPKPQCRVNTTTAASLCSKPFFDDQKYPTNLEEMDKLSCNSKELGKDYLKGVRPSCWFNRDAIDIEWPDSATEFEGTWIQKKCIDISQDKRVGSFQIRTSYSDTFQNEGVQTNNIYFYDGSTDCTGSDGQLAYKTTAKYKYGPISKDGIRSFDITRLKGADIETSYTHIKFETIEGKKAYTIAEPTDEKDGKTSEKRASKFPEEVTAEKMEESSKEPTSKKYFQNETELNEILKHLK